MTRPRARMVTDLTWESCETYKALREAPATRVPGIGNDPHHSLRSRQLRRAREQWARPRCTDERAGAASNPTDGMRTIAV